MVDCVLKQKGKTIQLMYSLLALCVFETFSLNSFAADLAHGQSIVKSVCASCHIGSSTSNAMLPLEAASADATNKALIGLGGMVNAKTKFNLQDSDIDDVAAFVTYEMNRGRPQSLGSIDVDLVTPPSQATITPQTITTPLQGADTTQPTITSQPITPLAGNAPLDADAYQKLQPLVAALKQATEEYKQDLSNGASSTVLMNDQGALKQSLVRLRRALTAYNTNSGSKKEQKKHRKNQYSNSLCLNGLPQNNFENANGGTSSDPLKNGDSGTSSDLLNINNSPTNITIINNIIYNNSNGNSSSGDSSNPSSKHKHSKGGGGGGKSCGGGGGSHKGGAKGGSSSDSSSSDSSSSDDSSSDDSSSDDSSSDDSSSDGSSSKKGKKSKKGNTGSQTDSTVSTGTTGATTGASNSSSTIANNSVFQSNCAVCHGADAQGKIGPNILGKTASDIQNALSSVSEMKSLKGTITDADIQSIAASLGSS